MRRDKTGARVMKRQEMLRELAAEEVVLVNEDGRSRAVDAVDALHRIQDGTYGVCVECGKRIRSARLQIKPEAMRCMACQSAFESRSAA